MSTNKSSSRTSKSVNGSRNSSTRLPVSTYRLQFNSSFTFSDAALIVQYLCELGVTECYSSPYFKARPGSLHGYDVCDYGSLNPEIGNEKEYQRFIRQLHRHQMGQILDFVPNHMSIFANSKWSDVLENGRASIYARFFDIDWYPAKSELYEKVLLPVLEDLYGNVLNNGDLQLVFEDGSFFVQYHEHQLPIDPKTYKDILVLSLDILRHNLEETDDNFLEFQSIITACTNLPGREALEAENVNIRNREKEIIKSRLSALCDHNKDVDQAINESVKGFSGNPGDRESFNQFHQLLEKQAYRLSYWKVGMDEINYRRFFDVNDLVAIRVEDPSVFSDVHRLVSDLVARGSVNGLRIDHVDGLYNPLEYFWRLQNTVWRDFEKTQEVIHAGAPDTDQSYTEPRSDIQDLINGRKTASSMPFYLVVEKILGSKENICERWPVAGTTGYEFAAAVDRLFVNKRHRRAITDIYRWFTRTNDIFQDIAYHNKNLVMNISLASEIDVLAHFLDRISERSRQYRDFTLNSLRDAIREVIACFPVYRTYVDSSIELIDDNDKMTINAAIHEARRRNPAISPAVFEFIRDILLLQYPSDMDEDGRSEQRLFIMRFQQLTGPVTAKGIEDTAFYVYNPLTSLNDVGGNPEDFGISIADFHRQNITRLKNHPNSIITTSTHDSKRSEDVRSRISVISEIPMAWRSSLQHWRQFNRNKKTIIDGVSVPDSNEEYLIYQTILGSYPADNLDEEGRVQYIERINAYMVKALREAKIHSSWINPETGYENAVSAFVAAILNPSPANRFFKDFAAINKLVTITGIYNSLSLIVLKFFSPGVPDIYQGNETWTYNLTDPDNRRPVNFTRRKRLLTTIKNQIGKQKLFPFADKLMSKPNSDKLKLYVTWKSLNYRKANNEIFNSGSYIPLYAGGLRRNHICSFARRYNKTHRIVVVPRLIAGLTRNSLEPPTGIDTWGNCYLILPQKTGTNRYRNIFTGEIVESHIDKQAFLKLSDIFKVFPVAVLEPE